MIKDIKTKLGLIGAGEFGNFAVKVMALLPDFELVAVADTDEKAVINLANKYQTKIYNNYLDLLKNKDVDIVLINTPNFLHAKMVEDCLAFGKKVLCEKPLGINLQEIISVEKIIKKYKGIILVNYLLPRSTIYQKLKGIIADNKYGELTNVDIKNLATESTIKSPWYWQKEKSGGWFLTADIHFYDLVLYLINEKINVDFAEESISDGRTQDILTKLSSEHTVFNIFHDFCAGYDKVDFTAKFVFQKAEIVIKGWIPTQMNIKTKNNSEVIKEKMDREIIYQKLVADNLAELAKMDYNDSVEHIKRVVKSSNIAFEAQKLADSWR